jgi:hypothetical protein
MFCSRMIEESPVTPRFMLKEEEPYASQVGYKGLSLAHGKNGSL